MGDCANPSRNLKMTNFWNRTTPGRPSTVLSTPHGRQGHLWAVQIDCRVVTRLLASKVMIFGPARCSPGANPHLGVKYTL